MRLALGMVTLALLAMGCDKVAPKPGGSPSAPTPSPSVVNCFGTPSAGAMLRGFVACEHGELAGKVGAGRFLSVRVHPEKPWQLEQVR